MKLVFFLSIFSISCATTAHLCDFTCAAVLCGPVYNCESGSHLESGNPSLCECCSRCVPNRKLYESCEENDQCDEGLTCSQMKKLCVNQTCDPAICTYVKCASVDECKQGTYKKYSTCGCCSTCAKYLGLGENCTEEGVKCSPELECSKETGRCVRKCSPDYCNLVDCRDVEKCPAGQILRQRNVKICRCCDRCENV